MRKIIHIDMDAFYASVELRERPDLRHLPVVISSHHPLPVIAAASYPARKFGLRSAMSMSQARKLCPQVVIIEPNFEKYRAISAQIHSIFQQYTTLIEPLSLDEAYLDVTEEFKTNRECDRSSYAYSGRYFQANRTDSLGWCSTLTNSWQKLRPTGINRMACLL